MEESREGFVKREDCAGLARSEDCCKTPEEKNLVRRIDQCTQELFQSLNAIRSTTETINKQLLPLAQEGEAKETTDKQEPQGWLEKHLDFLLTIYRGSINIHGIVLRLNKEIKTDKVGQ